MATDIIQGSSFVETFEIPGARKVHGVSFPLGIRPKDRASSADLDVGLGYLESLATKGVFDEKLAHHGVILFRGFPVKEASDFAKFTRAFKLPQPHREVGLAGRRTTVNDLVKTANEEPPDVKFYYHSEYGRSAHFPGVLFFFSQVVPQSGGQTPLLSSFELWDRIQEELPVFAKDILEKGVIGRQYFPSKDDPEAAHIGWNWQDSYGFDIQPGESLDAQHAKVEKVLREDLQAESEWQENGALHVLQKLPGIRRVASTGKESFFNGLIGVYGRARDNQALEHPYKGLDHKYHLPTTYGDGSAIPNEVLDRVIEISDEIGFLVPWQEGDVALINNFTVQHARSPWVGDRSLLVSLWDGSDKFIPL